MWCFIATFLVLLKTHVVVATIIGNGEAYDNYVLPTSHIAKLLDGMRRLPSWAAGSDFDPKHEFEVSKNYHRRLQEDWPDINSIMALANAAPGDGCVWLSNKLLAHLLNITIGDGDEHLNPDSSFEIDGYANVTNWGYFNVNNWCGPQALIEAFNNLTKTKVPSPKRYKSCAVIGSSGALSGSGMGSVIDAHDAVIRVNMAPTEGYEHDVGSRTTIRFLGTNTLIPEQILKNGDRGKPTMTLMAPDKIDMFYAFYLRFIDFEKSSKSSKISGANAMLGENMHVIPPSTFVFILEQWLNMHGGADRAVPDSPCHNPSLGAIALLWSIGACDRVNIAGFTLTHNVKKYSYYFDKLKMLKRFPNHDFQQHFVEQTQRQLNDATYAPCRTGNDKCHDLEYERAMIRRLLDLGAIHHVSSSFQTGPISCPSHSKRGDKANIIAFVGARSGSQRVPHKNIRPFYKDQSLLSIGLTELANSVSTTGGKLKSAMEILFSSDSKEYNRLASSFPGVTALMRESFFASSECTVSDYHGHVGEIMKKAAPHATHVLFYQITQPLLNRTTIRRFIDTFCDTSPEDHDSLLAVAPYVGHYVDKHGSPINFDRNNILGSQHLDPLYVAGKMSILPVDYVYKEKNLLGKSPKLFSLDHDSALDVDSMEDFEYAQYLYKKRRELLKQ